MNVFNKTASLNDWRGANDTEIANFSTQLERAKYGSSIRKKPPLNPKAYANLSAFDQALFETFTQGVAADVAFETLHDAFNYWAQVQPNATAVHHHGESMSYGMLNARAELLAAHLRDQGIGAGDRVGLYVKRPVHMLVGMLAVLKAGAAYVPLDIGISPKRQIEKITDTAQLPLILTLSQYTDKLPVLSKVSILCLDLFLTTGRTDNKNNVSTLNYKSDSG